MGDNNNELVVVELIRREMKSITDTLQRLNKAAVEKPNAKNKKTHSQSNSKISWQRPVSGQEFAEEGKRGSGKQQGKRDNQNSD